MRKIPYRYAVALVAALGLFMAVLDNTIVNVALTAMQNSFKKQDPNVDINTIQWVITGYFLAQAAIIPVAGYAGYRFGVKRMFIVALALFTVGSFLCGMSHYIDQWFGGGGVPLLVAFRLFQGIGGGMLFPLATSISFSVFPPAERAASSAVIAIPVLLAPTLGPTVGGLLVDSSFEWPSIFFINVPVGLAAIVLISMIYKPEATPQRAGAPGGSNPNAAAQAQSAADAGSNPGGQAGTMAGGRPQAAGAGTPGGAVARPKGFDFVGLLLSIVGTVMVVYAFNIVGQTKNPVTREVNGWGEPSVWAFLVGGLVVLLAFGWYETRVSKDPVLDLRLFKSNTFLVTSIVTWVVRAVIFGSFFILPLFLQQFKGQDAVSTGLALMPQGIGATIGIISGSRLYDIIGPRAQVVIGIIALTISSAWLIGISPSTDGWSLVPILLIRGIGFGWSNLPLQTVALSSVTGPALPKASSLYNATAQIFSSIGIAVLAVVFSQSLADRLGAVARATGGQISPAARLDAGVGAVSTLFVVVTIGTALTILVAFLLPAKSLKQQQQANAGSKTEGESKEAPAPAPVFD